MNKRIDALGRVVIPKEIRHQLKLVEGDELSIELNDNTICLSKMNKVEPFQNEIVHICNKLSEYYSTSVYFISSSFQYGIDEIEDSFYHLCHCYHYQSFHNTRINEFIDTSGTIYPLLFQQSWIGSFVVLSKINSTFIIECLCSLLLMKHR